MLIEFIKVADHRIRKDVISSYGISPEEVKDSLNNERTLYIKTEQNLYNFRKSELDIDETIKQLDRLLLFSR